MDQIAVASNFIPLTSLYGAQFSVGRTVLPVSAGDAIYANFKHVMGIPALPGTIVNSVDKLHILDALIGQLESIRKQNQGPPSQQSEKAMAQDIEAQIAEMARNLHRSLVEPEQPYIDNSLVGQPGALFSMAA